MKIEIEIFDDLNKVGEMAQLFDAYRVFYEQNSDTSGAENFLKSHISNKTSIIIVAKTDDKFVGFTQLYPSFSSVSMKKLYTLNDLFVSNEYRGKGIGELLIKFTQQLAISHGWKGMILETGVDNPAQKLYERLGWVNDKEYLHYSWLI